MGYQATVTIYLDALDGIENDPNFGKELSKAIQKHARRDQMSGHTESFNASSQYGSGNAGQVIAVHHSSEEATVKTGGNTGYVINVKPRTP